MRFLHIVMPMAGEGSRFLKEGWTTPKPLIELNGQPLFKHAISSVTDKDIQMKYSFIVRQEHIDKYQIDKGIRSFLPEANLFSVVKTTRGAVETCLIAENAIADDDAVIKQILNKPIEEATGGALVSFESNEPRYSYAALGEDGFVARTAEKEVISNHALCGAYFFASGRRFKQIAHLLLAEPAFTKPEYYVSLLFNYLLKDGEKVWLAPMEEYYSYGTPEELKRYL